MIAIGFSMVLDQASLRAFLAETGERRLLRVVMRSHDAITHSGAQIIELAIALTGFGLLAWALSWGWTPSVRRRVRVHLRRCRRHCGLLLIVLVCGLLHQGVQAAVQRAG
jgi:hypothetical protein